MPPKFKRPSRKACDGHLIGGVEHRRRLAAGLRPPPAPAPGRESAADPAASKSSRATCTQVQELYTGGHALGPCQRLGDGRAHVGRTRAAPAPSRPRTRPASGRRSAGGSRRRSCSAGTPNSSAGLDQLEALVHQGGRIDRDLASHAPVRMRAGLLRRDILAEPLADQSRNGPPDAVSRMRRTPGGSLAQRQPGRQALEDRVVLAVDRE